MFVLPWRGGAARRMRRVSACNLHSITVRRWTRRGIGSIVARNKNKRRDDMGAWVSASLNRKVSVALAIGLAATSLLFLGLFQWFYRDRLEQERAEASAQVNHLLQVSLENAMLKRDISGLAQIVTRLGTQERIVNVMIVNPKGEVRFASRPDLIGHRFDIHEDPTCSVCHRGERWDRGDGTLTRFMPDETGREVLRSINPVNNKPVCQQCHGAMEDNPINGILFVDYEAEGIRREALMSGLAFTGAGSLVVLLTVLGAWLLMRRLVLVPVARLTEASRKLSAGDLGARVALEGRDELARLGRTFDGMAAGMQASLATLEQKEKFLQDLIDAVPDGVRVIDSDFRIVKANRSYCDKLGYHMSQVVGSLCHLSSHDRMDPCPPTLITCPLHEIGIHRRPMKCVQRFLDKDGRELFVEITAAPLRTGGDRTMIVESIRDLSQQVALSHEHKLSELGQLATGVAHEIHNPLASARLSLQSLLRDFEEGVPDMAQVADYLKVLDGEIDECIDVTSRLLRLGAAPDEQLNLVNVDKALGDILALLAHEAERLRIQIDIDLEEAALRAMATESEVRMLILNIVQNAFHAMPGGGRLGIRGRRREGMLVLEFADDGVGIRPEDMPYILDPFFSRRADGVKGTGLGLAICKAILDRFDGRMECQSELGKGTRFTLYLPDADSSDEEAR
jgi:PAS domain S-box-containing protein